MCCIKPLHKTSLKRLRYTKFFKSSPRLNWSGGREDDGPKQKHHLSGSDFTIMFVLYPWNMKTQNFVSWTFRKTTLAFPVFNANISLILNISNASHECRLGEKYVVEQHSVEMFDDTYREMHKDENGEKDDSDLQETSRVAFRLLTVPAMFEARQWYTPLSWSCDCHILISQICIQLVLWWCRCQKLQLENVTGE